MKREDRNYLLLINLIDWFLRDEPTYLDMRQFEPALPLFLFFFSPSVIYISRSFLPYSGLYSDDIEKNQIL